MVIQHTSINLCIFMNTDNQRSRYRNSNFLRQKYIGKLEDLCVYVWYHNENSKVWKLFYRRIFIPLSLTDCREQLAKCKVIRKKDITFVEKWKMKDFAHLQLSEFQISCKKWWYLHLHLYFTCTAVSKNNIGARKMRNNCLSFQIVHLLSNIGLSLLPPL